MVLNDDELVHMEILLEDLARIRDVEAGPDGAIYLLLEHASGGQIVKLVPVERSACERTASSGLLAQVAQHRSSRENALTHRGRDPRVTVRQHVPGGKDALSRGREI